jgi:hypothetical protein
VGDIAEVPEPVARLVNQRAYSKVSAEIYTGPHKFSDNAGPCPGPVLRAVALLGGTPPMVKSLRDLPMAQFQPSLSSFSERTSMTKFDSMGTYRCFAGDSDPMSDQQLQAIIAQLQKLLPGLDPSSLTPQTLIQLASVLSPLVQMSDAFGPGCSGAGKGDRRFSDGRGITRIHSDVISRARRAQLLAGSPTGRHIARQANRPGR